MSPIEIDELSVWFWQTLQLAKHILVKAFPDAKLERAGTSQWNMHQNVSFHVRVTSAVFQDPWTLGIHVVLISQSTDRYQVYADICEEECGKIWWDMPEDDRLTC